MKSSLYLLALLICASTSLNAQVEKHEFNIIHNKKSIGTLVATKKTDDLKITYSDETKIVAHFLAKVNVDYTYDVVYDDGIFQNSIVLIQVNGHEHTKASTKKSGGFYQFIMDDDDEKDIKSSINYSSIRLLFDEPEGIKKIFSEEDGSFHTMEKTGEHSYQKTSPSGHKNMYYYNQGKLQKAEIHAGMISFTMESKI